MKKQNKVGVARWVSSGKEHLVVLRPFEKGLILHTMYYADEVRDFGAIDIEHGAIRDKEVQLAEMLIDELTEEKFDPMQFHDDYRGRLLDRIKAKAQGKAIKAPEKEEEEGGEVIDIMEALRRSLEGGRAASAPRHGRVRRAPRRAAVKGNKTRTPVQARKRKAS